ncbi:MAG: excinuclease ABC subunit UvrA [Paludibacteraceae bacterium]|nr:excinuclease ABC subunit UvrA [Paludibacteraceae bacterium]
MSENNLWLEVFGARVHNLKNIDVSIPRNKLTVITGLSGSGKSSLAFDTICAEGQRRYIETFSAYVRNFLGNMERPDVDKITGLSPVVSIEQKTTNKNPRSTVGTITEIYDFLRLLYARVGEAYSYVSGEKMVKYTEDDILNLIFQSYENQQVAILAPLVKGRKGHYRELFESVRKKGYLHVRIDGVIQEIVFGMKLDRYKNHDIEVVIDRLAVREKDEKRLKRSVRSAMKQGGGVFLLLDTETGEERYFSCNLMCPTSGISYADPAPHNFSFNTPKGACPCCKGIGTITQVDTAKLIPDEEMSIAQGGIIPLGKEKDSMVFWQISSICEKYGATLKTPIKDLSKEALYEILNGSPEPVAVKNSSLGKSNYFATYEGIVRYIELQQESSVSQTEQKWVSQFTKVSVCPECNGSRLKKEALYYRIAEKNIAEVSAMDMDQLYDWISNLHQFLSEKQLIIGKEIIKEIETRAKFLLDVGLNYLSLNRSSATLSGGESQRIRLATQIGSQLVNVLYILDEPSIGLHQRDNQKLIKSLKDLRDLGNTVVVVEHDKDMMLAADYLIDIGPLAGRLGGKVVFSGHPSELSKSDSLTAKYLRDEKEVKVPLSRREGNGNFLTLKGASGNNLKNVDVEIPLGKLICVTGVSGSGKSSLINGTLYPILSQKFYRSLQDPLPYKSIDGVENVDKVIVVNQSPIGRTPRSNPATYTGIFADIRNLFATLPEAKMRGYKSGRFSFNTKGGRCEVCQGNGYKTLEMNFMPDVLVPCEACGGKRYNRETLEVRYKGKSIADVLDMTINQAVEFYENIPHIVRKLKVLQEVGLGYVKLGQSATTFSGGESQRIKLAAELAKKDTGKTLYILDEPTTGLHFEDIRILLGVLNQLVEKGNSVIVIEHNMDIVKSSDHIIDIGPEGGKNGGEIVFCGTPEELILSQKGYTSLFLEKEFS